LETLLFASYASSLDICNDPSYKPNITHKHFSNTIIILVPSTKMMSSNRPSTRKVAILQTDLVQNDYKKCKTKLNKITNTTMKTIQVVVRE
jgi:hypothetical protein